MQPTPSATHRRRNSIKTLGYDRSRPQSTEHKPSSHDPPHDAKRACDSVRRMGELKFGPARVPSQESPEAAVEILLERGYTACEIDFEGRFWMDYDFATRLGVLAREHGIALSVHAPIAGFMGHAERGKKLNMAVGMLDHSAGIAKAAGAELVVFHPGSGEGTLRAEPLGEALARFDRPATVITESPDEASHQAIRAALFATVGESSAHRAS